jgi:hypothetical protein
MPNRDRIDHRLLRFDVRKDPMLDVRQEPAEHRRPEHNAGKELTHDRGLAEPLHRLAEEAPDQHQRYQFGEEHDFGRGLCFLRQRAACAEHEQRSGQNEWLQAPADAALVSAAAAETH